jgi:YVTN family beta-propeller protein
MWGKLMTTGYLYVPNESDNTVSVIDTSNDAVIATIPIAATPDGTAVSPDGTLVYVASESGFVSAIDTASNTVARELARTVRSKASQARKMLGGRQRDRAQVCWRLLSKLGVDSPAAMLLIDHMLAADEFVPSDVAHEKENDGSVGKSLSN